MPMLTTVRIRLPVTPVHAPGADLLGEGVDPLEHVVDVGATSWPSTSSGGVGRAAQRGVQHRPVLGDVDVLAARTSRRAARSAPTSLGEREQRGQDVVVEEVLRQVDVQVAGA